MKALYSSLSKLY